MSRPSARKGHPPHCAAYPIGRETRMSTAIDPTIPARAADYIGAHGWAQGQMEDDEGRVCLTGAIRACSPQPGDWLILREALRARGHGEPWNDADGRTQAEVVAALREPVTDADIAAALGPQWVEVVALVRQAATLTADQVAGLYAARAAAGDAAWTAAGDAAWSAAGDAAREAAWDAAKEATKEAAGVAARAAAKVAAREAAWDAAWEAAKVAARAAAGDAAGALVVRDVLIETDAGTGHYLTLTTPWRSMVGRVHPDDADLITES